MYHSRKRARLGRVRSLTTLPAFFLLPGLPPATGSDVNLSPLVSDAVASTSSETSTDAAGAGAIAWVSVSPEVQELEGVEVLRGPQGSYVGRHRAHGSVALALYERSDAPSGDVSPTPGRTGRAEDLAEPSSVWDIDTVDTFDLGLAPCAGGQAGRRPHGTAPGTDAGHHL